MAENPPGKGNEMGMTRIEWADRVWNPITGCTPISEGCSHCYAKRMAMRLGGRFGYPRDDPFGVTWHPERLMEPAGWRKPSGVFVCSMGDLFHDDVRDDWLGDVWHVMEQNPRHVFMVLTKRPARARGFLVTREPMKHIWVGVSAENQERADERIPVLAYIPAGKRFVSVEPMLGPVDLRHLRVPARVYESWQARPVGELVRYDALNGHTVDSMGIERPGFPKLDWVIAGPETPLRPGQRDVEEKWIEGVCVQCEGMGVPFFDKRKIGWFAREWPE